MVCSTVEPFESVDAARARQGACMTDGLVWGGVPIAQLARDYGTVKPAAIRVNYGMQRTRGTA